jgi:predicted MFS family arabinose efflux permease
MSGVLPKDGLHDRQLVPGFTSLLAVAQLVTWGAIYYSFTLFVEPMEAELHLGRTGIMGAMTLGLLVCAMCSPFVGLLVDQGRARRVMAGGVLLAGAMMVAWSMVETTAGLYVVWSGMGVAMAATLFEPAFAVLVRALGDASKKEIANVVVVSGLASTLFIPLTHALIDAYGWRGALLALAAIHVCVTGTIYLLILKRDIQSAHIAGDLPRPGIPVMTTLKAPSFWCLSIGLATAYLVGSGLILHILPMLTERGFTTDQTALAAAFYGLSLMAARVLLMRFAVRMRLDILILMAIGPVILGLVYLYVGVNSPLTIIAYTALLGCGNGLLTLVKPYAVAQLFDPASFGAINGAMTTPMFIVRALAPISLAGIWTMTGSYETSAWILGGLLVLAFAALQAGLFLAKPSTSNTANHSEL